MTEEKGTEINMVEQLCGKLAKAKAGSEFVIAVFCDIRGFSDFSTKVESAQTATFLKYFYLTLLRDYFKNAAFAKPNGDGLLMVFQHDDENLKDVSADILQNCFKALKDFPEMFKGIPLINYATPKAIGFGIARGSASYLALGNEKLDYSGKLLNLAARLTELARPQGIVIDGNYQMEIIPESLRADFKSAKVFIRGIAEDIPIEVLFPESVVKLPPEAFQPINYDTWKVVFRKLKVSELLNMTGRYVVPLPEQPLGKDKIKAEHVWPDTKVRRNTKSSNFDYFELSQNARGYEVVIDLAELKEFAKVFSYSDKTIMTIIVHYVPKPQLVS